MNAKPLSHCTEENFKAISPLCRDAYQRTELVCDQDTLKAVIPKNDACEHIFQLNATQLFCLDRLLEASWDCFIVPGLNITDGHGQLVDFPANVSVSQFSGCDTEQPDSNDSSEPAFKPTMAPSEQPHCAPIVTQQPTQFEPNPAPSVAPQPSSAATASKHLSLGLALVGVLARLGLR